MKASTESIRPRSGVIFTIHRLREKGDRGLLTICDCGAAHEPPTAKLLGTIESIDAPAAIESIPTGRVVTLREAAALEEPTPGRDRIRRP